MAAAHCLSGHRDERDNEPVDRFRGDARVARAGRRVLRHRPWTLVGATHWRIRRARIVDAACRHRDRRRILDCAFRVDRTRHFTVVDRVDATTGRRNDRSPLRLAACAVPCREGDTVSGADDDRRVASSSCAGARDDCALARLQLCGGVAQDRLAANLSADSVADLRRAGVFAVGGRRCADSRSGESTAAGRSGAALVQRCGHRLLFSCGCRRVFATSSRRFRHRRLAACGAHRYFGRTRVDCARRSSRHGHGLGARRVYCRDRVVRRIDIRDRRHGALVDRRRVALSECVTDDMDARELVA